VFYIQSQAFFRAIAPNKVRGHAIYPLIVPPSKVTDSRPLDLDYTGSKVCELAGAERSRDRVFKSDDRNSG
jgi:hypothetical protein